MFPDSHEPTSATRTARSRSLVRAVRKLEPGPVFVAMILIMLIGGYFVYDGLQDGDSGDDAAPPDAPPVIDEDAGQDDATGADDPMTEPPPADDPSRDDTTPTGEGEGPPAPADEPGAATPTTSIVAIPDELVGAWTQTDLIRAAADEVIAPTDPLLLEFGADGTFTQRLQSSSEVDEQLFRLVAEGDDLRLRVYDSPEALEAQEHDLSPLLELDGDALSLIFGDESTLVFERDID